MTGRPVAALALLVAAACGSSGAAPAADAGPADARPPRSDAPTTCPADGGTAAHACDPFLSCGCASDQKCVPGQVGLACLPLGTTAPGEPCTDDTSCARGATCVSYAGATTCHLFCDDVHPCPPVGGGVQACYVGAADRSGSTVAMLCGPGCSIVAQGCPAGLGCYPLDSANPDQGGCFAPGTAGPGAACKKLTDCQAGYVCVGTSSPICAKICDRQGGSPSCNQATEGTCKAFASSSGNSQSGVCLP